MKYQPLLQYSVNPVVPDRPWHDDNDYKRIAITPDTDAYELLSVICRMTCEVARYPRGAVLRIINETGAERRELGYHWLAEYHGERTARHLVSTINITKTVTEAWRLKRAHHRHCETLDGDYADQAYYEYKHNIDALAVALKGKVLRIIKRYESGR